MGVNRPAMDSVCDEVLTLILEKLPIRDVVRASAVCHRWRKRMDAETAKFGHGRGYCPLAFQRFDEQHTCLGFDSATWKWESLPSLSNVPRAIHLAPIAGSGSNGLLAFKVSQQYSEYLVGSPYSQKWTTLPKSADSWGDAAMFMATTTQWDSFRVVAVRETDTHIYKSESDEWMKVERTPQSVQEARVVSCIRSKACAAVNNCLYTTDGNFLIAFDMRTDQWVIDRIHIPISKYVIQVVGCAGSLFVVTEEESGRISVWERGVLLQEFSLTEEMPQMIRGYLGPAVVNARSRKLRSFGHGQMLFFWRRNSLVVVSYDLRTRGWRKLPDIVMPDIVAAGEPPQVIVDAGFFEPKHRTRPRNASV